MKLLAALDRFSLQLRADGRSEHTIKNYSRHVALLDRWLHAYSFSDDLGQVFPEVLAAFLTSDEARASARGGPKSTASMNSLRTSVRVVFAWFHQAGLVPTNAARLVRRGINSPAPPRALSEEEVGRLRTSLQGARTPVARRDRMLVELLVGTGIRVNSAVTLDIDDVDLASGVLTLRACKGDRCERAVINSSVAEKLREYIARLPGPGPLFRNPRGERISKRTAQKRIVSHLQRAGIEGRTAHSLRHSFATRLLGRTHDLFLVQKALHHKSILSTSVYLSVDDSRLRAAMEDGEPRDEPRRAVVGGGRG
jgi:integrase/recombinase XerC